LVFYDSPHIGHVAIYLGNGRIIEDPHTGDKVKVTGVGTPVATARWWDRSQAGSFSGAGGGAKTGKGAGAGAGALVGVPNAGAAPSIASAASRRSAALAITGDLRAANAL